MGLLDDPAIDRWEITLDVVEGHPAGGTVKIDDVVLDLHLIEQMAVQSLLDLIVQANSEAF